MISEESGEERQPLWFLVALALAAAGGAVAYVPFLTVLLPLKVNELAASENIEALSYITFAGAIFASLANIGFGWVSDRWGGRRSWIALGLVLSCLLLIVMGEARSVGGLIVLVIAWQLALNMMLAPLTAWAGDCVPDTQKGLLGGLFALAPALGALAGTLVTLPGLAVGAERLWLVSGLVALLVAPALVLGSGRQMEKLMRPVRGPVPGELGSFKSRPAIVRMWSARLLVQIA
ncbi:MAG: MFS transporter, partial [Altererythrobacter sp.]|nr:MFS transporter [Altererythrobacter sp.]